MTADDGTALETLALLYEVGTAELEPLWQEDFIDRQVEAAVNGLFEPEPDPGLVCDSSVSDYRQSFHPATFAPPWFDRERPEEGTRHSRVHRPRRPLGRRLHRQAQGRGRRQLTAKEPRGAKSLLGDIIKGWQLRPPVELFKNYKGNDLHGRIEPDGRVSFGGQVYATLSAAGVMARRSVIGSDQRAQTNGWAFWRYRTDDGEWRVIDELRRRLWENRSTSP